MSEESKHPTCGTCPYWFQTECRRSFPDGMSSHGPVFPVTRPTDWCGSHPESEAIHIASVSAPMMKNMRAILEEFLSRLGK